MLSFIELKLKDDTLNITKLKVKLFGFTQRTDCEEPVAWSLSCGEGVSRTQSEVVLLLCVSSRSLKTIEKRSAAPRWMKGWTNKY